MEEADSRTFTEIVVSNGMSTDHMPTAYLRAFMHVSENPDPSVPADLLEQQKQEQAEEPYDDVVVHRVHLEDQNSPEESKKTDLISWD